MVVERSQRRPTSFVPVPAGPAVPENGNASMAKKAALAVCEVLPKHRWHFRNARA